VSAHFGYCPVILHADNFYAFAGNLGYEGHAFTDDDTFGSPNTVSPVAATDGTIILKGDVPMLPPPPLPWFGQSTLGSTLSATRWHGSSSPTAMGTPGWEHT
jgi:hypothetical protein